MVGPTSIGMPSWGLVNTDFAYQKGLLEQRIVETAKIGKVEYPLVALIDRNGHILYHSTGYKIGVIEQILKAWERGRPRPQKNSEICIIQQNMAEEGVNGLRSFITEGIYHISSKSLFR